MPTYEYACTECGEHLEVVQSFRDESLTTCGKCSGRLRKVFSAAGIIFKGSGYYVTDTRAKPVDADGGKSSETKSGETKSSEKKATESKDAPASSGESRGSGSSDSTAESA